MRLTVDSHAKLREQGTDLRVLVNGVDVTDHCREADDVEGWALILRTNELGRHYLDPLSTKPEGEIAMETLHGEVVFVPRRS